MKFNELENIIIYHLNKYPVMEITDIVKLIYQNEYGDNDLTAADSLSSIAGESEDQSKEHKELMEYIGDGVCRVYIDAFLDMFWNRELASKILTAMFIESQTLKKGNLDTYNIKLNSLLEMIKSGVLMEEAAESFPLWTCDLSLAADFIAKHKAQGLSAPSHSDAYIKAYKPHYRIILSEFYRYINLFSAIEQLLKDKPMIIIAIDGKCGSGKTTLGKMIQYAFEKPINCQIIAMDDFFLPAQLRSEERYNTPGSNLHYERFIEEVVTPLKESREFSYKAFNCKIMDYENERKHIEPKGVIIVEGSYAMREDFRDIYDLKVFLDISPLQQKERIINRNGHEAMEMFENKWIPMENKYFQSCEIPKYCNYIYDSDLVTKKKFL